MARRFVLRRTASSTVLQLALAALLAGCANVPSQEMSDARRAIGAAQEAGAERHAPAAMSRASRAMGGATDALRSGDYPTAQRLAGTAHSEAIAARELALRVADIESAIDAARRAQQPWQGARDLLARALEFSRQGDMQRALAVAARARALLP